MSEGFWTSREFLSVAAAVIAGVSLLAGAALNHRFTKVREDAAAKRQTRKEKLEANRSMFEEAVSMLDAHIQSRGRGDASYGENLRRITARMELSAPQNVRELFSQTANLVDTWAAHARESEPKRVGEGLLVFTHSPAVKEHEAEAQRLLPEVWAMFERLKRAMSEELGRLEVG